MKYKDLVDNFDDDVVVVITELPHPFVAKRDGFLHTKILERIGVHTKLSATQILQISFL